MPTSMPTTLTLALAALLGASAWGQVGSVRYIQHGDQDARSSRTRADTSRTHTNRTDTTRGRSSAVRVEHDRNRSRAGDSRRPTDSGRSRAHTTTARPPVQQNRPSLHHANAQHFTAPSHGTVSRVQQPTYAHPLTGRYDRDRRDQDRRDQNRRDQDRGHAHDRGHDRDRHDHANSHDRDRHGHVTHLPGHVTHRPGAIRVQRPQGAVTVLPRGYRTEVIGGVTYYCHGTTYYRPRYENGHRIYVIVDRPVVVRPQPIVVERPIYVERPVRGVHVHGPGTAQLYDDDSMDVYFTVRGATVKAFITPDGRVSVTQPLHFGRYPGIEVDRSHGRLDIEIRKKDWDAEIGIDYRTSPYHVDIDVDLD